MGMSRRVGFVVVFSFVLVVVGSGVVRAEPGPVLPPGAEPSGPGRAAPLPEVNGSSSLSGRFDEHLLDRGSQRDPSAGAPLSAVGSVDRSSLDPSKRPAAVLKVEAKNARVKPVAVDTELVDVGGRPVKVGEFVSVRRGKKVSETPVGVRVAVRDEADTEGLGGQKLSFTLDRTDAGTDVEVVEVEIAYNEFRDAYGADWATRVRFVKFPDCQGQKGCVDPVEVVASTNNLETGVLTALVSLPPVKTAGPIVGRGRGVLPRVGGGTVGYGTSSGAAGSGGDWGSTSLQPSASWSAGGNMGGFNYSYPFTAVPATGPVPQMGVSYSSQSVDGLTASTNNQGGLLGPGWDVSGGGFIERSYRGCAGDFEPPTNAGGDWCWAGYKSAGQLVGDGWAGWSLNLNGQSSALIADG